jgi:putative colanic acid biosynthesis acetyltransferase WcaF
MVKNEESPAPLDIATNRLTKKWTHRQLVGRALWEYGGALVFAAIPRPFWGLRRAVLRAYGARVGHEARIFPSVRIIIPWNLTIGTHAAVGDRAILYALGPIVIGDRATISQGAHLCAGSHDYRDPTMPLLKLPIVIGKDVWICADAFVGPAVTIGDHAIIGARAVIMRNVANDVIVVGNPAREIGRRERLPEEPMA